MKSTRACVTVVVKCFHISVCTCQQQKLQPNAFVKSCYSVVVHRPRPSKRKIPQIRVFAVAHNIVHKITEPLRSLITERMTLKTYKNLLFLLRRKVFGLFTLKYFHSVCNQFGRHVLLSGKRIHHKVLSSAALKFSKSHISLNVSVFN